MPDHTPGDWDRQAERRNGDGRRIEDQVRHHDIDAYAHGPLIDRMMTGAAPIRADIEARLRWVERRMFALTLVGSGLLVCLGGVVGVLVAKALK